MIKTVLFDVDGVLLSEEHYFDASALTVWELLYSGNYLGLAPDKFHTDVQQEEIDAIRREVFQDDKVLSFMKSRGLNANWDMIYITFSYQLIHLLSQVEDSDLVQALLSRELDREALMTIGKELKKTGAKLDFEHFLDDFQKTAETKRGLFRHLDKLVFEKMGIETKAFGEKGVLWSICEHISQEWYVGDEHVFQSTGRPSVQTGKKGFLANETTLCPQEQIEGLFSGLLDAGVSIGIGTGRPELETIQPFNHLDWVKYFNVEYIVTADDVLRAERQFPDRKSLAKPHPYTFMHALLGKRVNVDTVLGTSLPLENGNEVLVVGDSLADLLAARDMGCQFAAVLTGLTGEKARGLFEEHQADYIFDNVMGILGLVRK
ncbi:phosphatase [Bacillus sp. FJAT-27225]|uniref:HAD family hydrolase n=1 Tax=Bacillus sp. FJAT-27225 TaxID=1743144 RepID=UPI00080C285C|nr:HAD hydrolase-like protein [Bacillus sp. FJAT-27225]OCA83381.1 phosphatase [Bacillus sp. FJAT-27225]